MTGVSTGVTITATVSEPRDVNAYWTVNLAVPESVRKRMVVEQTPLVKSTVAILIVGVPVAVMATPADENVVTVSPEASIAITRSVTDSPNRAVSGPSIRNRMFAFESRTPDGRAGVSHPEVGLARFLNVSAPSHARP